MKLKCPTCGTPIPSDNINIKTMMAVCPRCDNVFAFQAEGVKRQRKLKAPEQFVFYDDDRAPLHFAFKWSWRTEPLFAFAVLMFILMMSFVVLFGALSEGSDSAALLGPILMGAFPAYYGLSLILNSTHFTIEQDLLKVYTVPLWFPYYGVKKIPLADITQVTTEQVYAMPGASSREAFYSVYAHSIDQQRFLLVKAVNYEHAHFIAQEIGAYVASDAHQEVALFDMPDDSSADETVYPPLESGTRHQSRKDSG